MLGGDGGKENGDRGRSAHDWNENDGIPKKNASPGPLS